MSGLRKWLGTRKGGEVWTKAMDVIKAVDVEISN